MKPNDTKSPRFAAEAETGQIKQYSGFSAGFAGLSGFFSEYLEKKNPAAAAPGPPFAPAARRLKGKAAESYPESKKNQVVFVLGRSIYKHF